MTRQASASALSLGFSDGCSYDAQVLSIDNRTALTCRGWLGRPPLFVAVNLSRTRPIAIVLPFSFQRRASLVFVVVRKVANQPRMQANRVSRPWVRVPILLSEPETRSSFGFHIGVLRCNDAICAIQLQARGLFRMRRQPVAGERNCFTFRGSARSRHDPITCSSPKIVGTERLRGAGESWTVERCERSWMVQVNQPCGCAPVKLLQ